MIQESFKKKLVKAAPRSTLSWESHAKKRRIKYIAIIVIGIILIALSYTLYSKVQESKKTLITVMSAKNYMEAGTEITEADISTLQIKKEILPRGHFTSKETLINQTLTQNIEKNAIITEADVTSKIVSDSKLYTIKDGEVLIEFDESWFESLIPETKKGDTISILVSNPETGIENTFFVTKGSEVIDVTTDSKKQITSLLIKVREEEAKNILYARSHKLIFLIMLSK